VSLVRSFDGVEETLEQLAAVGEAQGADVAEAQEEEQGDTAFGAVGNFESHDRFAFSPEGGNT
jgi:hypothetical protein